MPRKRTTFLAEPYAGDSPPPPPRSREVWDRLTDAERAADQATDAAVILFERLSPVMPPPPAGAVPAEAPDTVTVTGFGLRLANLTRKLQHLACALSVVTDRIEV